MYMQSCMCMAFAAKVSTITVDNNVFIALHVGLIVMMLLTHTIATYLNSGSILYWQPITSFLL